MMNLSQDNRYPGRDTNRVPPKIDIENYHIGCARYDT
jgi:hypothetical protein